jgi:hypothetical protein
MGVDTDDPLRLGSGQSLEALVDAAVKLQALLFEPVGKPRPDQPHLRRKIQPQGEVRLQTAGGQMVELADLLQVQPSPVALVSQSGIDKSVANHHLTGCQRRRNNFAHVFGPICRV